MPVRRAAVALVLLLDGCGGDPTAATPEKVFADAFESPLEGVKIEAAGGTVVRGYDAWLKILPTGRLLPRHEQRYAEVDCFEPRAFFNRVLGSEALTQRHIDLQCQGFSDERFDFDNGRWLIRSHADGRVYYRVWKHYSPR
jgi:hypothetical protein